MSPAVSIVIPAYNDAKTLEQTIPSILNQEYDGDIEIILVDDNSTDNTLEVAKKYLRDNFKMIHHDKNMGLASSVNDGVKNAKHDLVCILHDDILLPDENWLSTMVSHVTSDDSIAAVTAPSIIPDDVWNDFGFWEKAMFAWERYTQVGNSEEIVRFLSGKNDLFRKQIFLEMGGFDSKTYRVACEDFDLCYKLKRNGYEIISVPRPTYHMHSSHSTGWRNILKKNCQLAEGQGVLFRKYRHIHYWNSAIFKTVSLIFLIIPINLVRLLGLIYLLGVVFGYTYKAVKATRDFKMLFLVPPVKVLDFFLNIICFWKGAITQRQTL